MKRTLLLLVLVLAACGPTGYFRRDDESDEFGYADKPIGNGEFSVVARGNSYTSRQRVAEIALLRAAHLAREQGRKRFLIVNQKEQVFEAYKLDRVPVPLGGTVLSVPFQERSEKEPMAVLIIRLVPDEPAPGALDASEVIAQLTPHFTAHARRE